MMKKHIYIIGVALVACLGLSGCNDDDEVRHVMPEVAGSFVDVRDGEEYHYVRYGNLEWTCENARYVIGDENLSKIYQGAEVPNGAYSTVYWQKYGCLYSLKGAKVAAPDGWRVPSDADWQNLECCLGMSAGDAAALEWRGNVAQWMLTSGSEDDCLLGLLLGGYFTQHTLMGTSGYRFMSAFGYYWTATADETKNGSYYFYRKFAYNRDEVYRQSMESDMQMLSVRFCRDVRE